MDGSCIVWDLQTASLVASFNGRAKWITSVNFCPNPNIKYLVATSLGGTIAFWKYSQSSGQVAVFQPNPTEFHERFQPLLDRCISFSASGMFFATLSADHHISVYKMCENGQNKILESQPPRMVSSIQWAHSGIRFMSGSYDRTALLWKFENQLWKTMKLDLTDRLETCPKSDDSTGFAETKVCWDFSDDFVMTAVQDNSIKVWNSKTGKLQACLRGHSSWINALESHPKDAHVLLSAGYSGQIQIILWDINKGVRLANLIDDQTDQYFYHAKWSPDGTKIVAIRSSGQILLFGFGTEFKDVSNPRDINQRNTRKPFIKPLSSSMLQMMMDKIESTAIQEMTEYSS